MKKAPLIILMCCLGIVAALVWAAITVETTASLAKPHALQSSMQTSGGMQRDLGIWAPGVVVGVLTLVAAAAAFSLGVKRTATRGIAVAAGLSLIAFTGMMLAQRNYAGAEIHAVSGWFTAPVNWLLFGLGIFPAAYVGVWVFGFRRWVFSSEDQAKFDSLLERSRSRENRKGGE